MSWPPDDPGDGVHLEATAHDQGVVNQAGRDLHVHHGDGIRRVARHRDDAGAVCPYPGLLAFTDEQAGWFFGRDELTADLIARMDAAVASGGPVMVVAASGAGKSSLLQAGLLRKIADGALPAEGSRDWPQAVIIPGEHPMRAAAAALTAGLPATAAEQSPRDVSADDLDALLGSLAQVVAAPGGPATQVVLIVDQFEELFTLCDSAAERAEFISWLWRAASPGRAGGPLAVVACGLRADFYAQCVTGHEELRRSLQADQVVVGPMSERELRQAITLPARVAGLEVEPGLADLFLSDLRASRDDSRAGPGQGRATTDYEAGRLPLLAHALRATWQQRHGSVLTVDGYRATGGIDRAIAETADRVYARLDPAGQREARLIFLRLVKIGDAPSSDGRRPAPRSDLATSPAAGAVLDAYIASRLLTSSQDAVQITHEALLSAWPKLKGWLEDDRAANLTRQRAEDTAAAWQRARHDASLLYRGASLEAVASWEDAHPGELTQTARDFLATSRRLARRAARIRRGVISALTALMLIATTAAGVAIWQATVASQQRDQAITNQDQAIFNDVVAEAGQLQGTNQPLATQLNLTAWRMHPTPALATQLRSTSTGALASPVTGPAGIVRSVAFSPDGRTLAAGGGDDRVWLWNVTNPAHPIRIGQPLVGPTGPLDSVAFSPDGRTLAAGGGDDRVWLWNVTNPAHPTQLGQPLAGPTNPIGSVAFSPDGRTLAAGSGDDRVWLWNVANPADPTPLGQPLTGPASFVESVAFSPDGRTLAAGGGDQRVWLWNVTNPAHPTQLGQPLAGPGGPIESVAFSPDGRTLAAGSDDRKVYLWNVTNPARPAQLGQPLAGPTNIVESVAFSPDGHTLAAGGNDDRVWLWNVTNPADPVQLGQPLTGPTGYVGSVAFSPDGHTLAAGSNDNRAWLWDLPTTVVTGPGNPVGSVAFSPDGRTLAAGSGDDRVWLWNVANPADPVQLGQPLTGPASFVESVAFSPDGHTLAAGGGDDKVWLWNVTNPAHPIRIGRPLTGPGGPVQSVAFSPDGRTLAAGSGDQRVWLWNVTNLARPTQLGQALAGPANSVNSVAFSPDGRTLAAGSDDDRVWLWNVANPADPTPLGPLTGPANSVNSVAFSPDGHILAAGSGDQRVWLWNVTNPARPTPLGPLTGPTNAVASVAFSPDGHTLAAGSDDQRVWLWDETDLANPTSLTGPTNFVGSVAFSPDGRTLAAGGFDHDVWLWNLDLSQVIDRICATTSGNLTPGQWARYVPQLPYDPPCRHL